MVKLEGRIMKIGIMKGGNWSKGIGENNEVGSEGIIEVFMENEMDVEKGIINVKRDGGKRFWIGKGVGKVNGIGRIVKRFWIKKFKG